MKNKIITLIVFFQMCVPAFANDKFIKLGDKAYNLNTFDTFEKHTFTPYRCVHPNYNISVTTTTGKRIEIYFNTAVERDNAFNKLLRNLM